MSVKHIPILTPPQPIRAHVPRSLPVSQQMLIGVTPLHSQLHCISLIICTGMTHTHTQGFPCCLGDEMPACVCEGQCVVGVWVRCVCLFADEAGGVLEWAVAVFQDSLQMSQASVTPALPTLHRVT